MACIEARGLRKAYGTTVALDGIDLRVEEGRILGPHRPQRRGQDHGAERHPRPDSYRGRTEGARPRSLDPARPADARRLLHRRRGGAAALDAGLAGAGLCRRRASALRPRQGRGLPGQDHDQADAAGSGELSKGMVTQLHLALVMAIDAKLLVLDEPTLGLDLLYRKQFYDSLLNDYFDKQPDDRGHHPPGGGDPAHPHRPDVHRPRPDRAGLQHGGFRGALRRGDGAPRAARRRAGAEADPRAPGVRPQHHAVRRRRPRAARRARRGAHPQHRRPVRRRDRRPSAEARGVAA